MLLLRWEAALTRGGQIETGKLIRIFTEFELTVDIEKLIEEVRQQLSAQPCFKAKYD